MPKAPHLNKVAEISPRRALHGIAMLTVDKLTSTFSSMHLCDMFPDYFCWLLPVRCYSLPVAEQDGWPLEALIT